jgi:hypothetical protein
MKRLRFIAIIVIVLLVGWLVVHLTLNREPRYQGRGLSRWLVDYDRAFMFQLAGSGDVPDASAVLVASTNALRHISTNAIPFLLEKLTAKDNAVKKRLNSRLDKQAWIRFRFTDQLVLAQSGFRLLGNEAVMATPALARLTQHPDPDVRSAAVCSLYSIKPERETLLPILLKTLHDPYPQVSQPSAVFLNKLYPEEAEKAVGLFSTSGGTMPMRKIAIALLVSGAMIVTHGVTRYRAFFDFSPEANSETAGFIAFRSMLSPVAWGLVVIALSAFCFYRARRRS